MAKYIELEAKVLASSDAKTKSLQPPIPSREATK